MSSISIPKKNQFVTEFFVEGDKDTFYPVTFRMPTGTETEIQIYRAFNWNSVTSDKVSAFGGTHVASALVILKGQSHSWDGNANYLRTLVNMQRYRQTVAGISFCAFSEASKLNSTGRDTVYNKKSIGFITRDRSGFMLRGGGLQYEIHSNKKINFNLLNAGDVVVSHSHENVKWIAKTMKLSEIKDDPENTKGTNYIGY